MILVSVLFIGLAGGLLSPPMMLLVPKVVQPQARALGIAVMSSSILLGQFMSPLFTQAVSLLCGDDTFRFKFYMISIVLVAFTIVGTIYIWMYNLKTKKN